MNINALHFFGDDPLDAVCSEAMGRIVQPFDLDLAYQYFRQANWIAQSIGRRDWRAGTPTAFRNCPDLQDEFNEGALGAIDRRGDPREA